MESNKKLDKKYAAIGAGERTSKKFATIRKSDGTSFKRKNANQYYPDGVPGGEDYTEKRPNRTDKGVWYKEGGELGNKSLDKKYAAIGAGERTSKKFATIRKSDGTSFKRKNANQYYPDGVPGGEDYTEKRRNRTDKGVWYEEGGGVEMAAKGMQIYEEIYSSPRKLFVKELIEDLGADSIVINSNGDTRKFSQSITKNDSKYYAIFPAKSLTGTEETDLVEKNGDLLLFRNKFKTKEALLEKLASVYGVNNKMATGGGVNGFEYTVGGL
jgi:hypothetical protein